MTLDTKIINIYLLDAQPDLGFLYRKTYFFFLFFEWESNPAETSNDITTTPRGRLINNLDNLIILLLNSVSF